MSMSLVYNQCYHGTSKENQEKISSDKEFLYTKRNDHWLGYGTYFFLEDKEKAKWFTKNDKRVSEKEKCIICVTVEIEPKNLLNLDIEKDRKMLDNFIKDYSDLKPKLSSENMESNNQHRCFHIELFKKYHKNTYKAVKYTFSDDKISYSYINKKDSTLKKDRNHTRISNNGIQLCVIDQDIINFDELSVECI